MFKLDRGNDFRISCKWYGFGLKGQRSTLGLGLTAIRHGFDLYECLLVFADFKPNMTTLRLANGMANPSVRLSVVCDVRAPYSGGLTFRGYFAPYCSLAIRQLIHQKITKIVRANLPNRRAAVRLL